MGEVYKARDARLGRDVAIKVLAASITNESERLKRFEQEARAVAALNHPNILTIYEIETHDGSPYLVSELLEGETLAAQSLNGVLASGTRVTHTIPAGTIGNSQALETVRETWMADDLKVPVMTKTTDPRMGTTTMELTAARKGPRTYKGSPSVESAATQPFNSPQKSDLSSAENATQLQPLTSLFRFGDSSNSRICLPV